MYEELVTALRQCAEASCAGCKNDIVQIGCRGMLQNEAADAIEELSVVVRAQKAVLDQSPHWIPAEDCLPVNGEEIITLGPNGGMECGFFRGLCGTHKDKWEWKKHTVRTVKFWMPRRALPEPPKEE